jgi:hypothetical protein
MNSTLAVATARRLLVLVVPSGCTQLASLRVLAWVASIATAHTARLCVLLGVSKVSLSFCHNKPPYFS